MNEEQLENLCLDSFREGVWGALHAPDTVLDDGEKLPIAHGNRSTPYPAELPLC